VGLKEGTFSAFRSPNRLEPDGYAFGERPVVQVGELRVGDDKPTVDPGDDELEVAVRT
jgi:hypothetical protein